MKKFLIALSLFGLASTASANFFGGGNNGEWKTGPYGPYWEENDWPEWTPMYWMQEMSDSFSGDDDNNGFNFGNRFGNGNMPFFGNNSNYGYGNMPFFGNNSNYGYGNSMPMMPYGYMPTMPYGVAPTPYYGGYGMRPMPAPIAPALPVAPAAPVNTIPGPNVSSGTTN
ncbi:hypothetical protein SAMN02745130_00121 [Thiothrix eikelboomii]|uniref:Sulfur globule protein CV1 n=1 Tax=Thiothrix eikelboomii TaxID=92487 RepID=A0A1T4VS38_9GAMM|nr:hypothetical protein [Thiothrix eikelboomii]SKA67783.1 hypothetical protein SAMN02745130_00121 [Thiothrix eikelboomii]